MLAANQTKAFVLMNKQLSRQPVSLFLANQPQKNPSLPLLFFRRKRKRNHLNKAAMELHKIDIEQAFLQADKLNEGVICRYFINPLPGSPEAGNKKMINLLLFLQKQKLATAIYLFGLGTLLSGPGLKHMRLRSHHDLTGTLVTPLLLGRTWWSTKSPTCLPLSVSICTNDRH